MTMTELKNHFDKVHELVADAAFVKTVYLAVKSQAGSRCKRFPAL